jgi:hypothetical protein
MRYGFAIALLAILLFIAPRLEAQAPKDAKGPPKGKKIESLPGFKKFTIDGFTVLVRDDVLKEQENSTNKRKPLEALEIELRLVSKVMTKPQADAIRNNVQVWVEWDVIEAMSNGRAGTAYGLYLGTHPRPILIDKNPVYVSGVRILQMKGVTKRHQTDDAHDSVFLHEFAHAFHDLVLGYENEAIKNAYKQALERKLYDKSSYLTTNEKEFFAELSCTYLDKLDSFPHNREELKKHDSVTFKLLESIWGRKKDDKVVAKNKPSFNIDFDSNGLKLGEHLSGPVIVQDDLKGRVVLVSFWEPSWPDVGPGLQKMQGWQLELSDYGLVVLSEASWGAPNLVPLRDDSKVRIEKTIQSSGTSLTHYFNGTLKGLEGLKTYPHAVLFDPRGKCIYRGDLFGAESEMRSAVGKALVAASGVEQFLPALLPSVEALQKGAPPSTMLPKFIAIYTNGGATAEAREQAQAVIKQLTAPAQKRLDEAEKLMKTDPLAAYERIESVPANFKGTKIANKAKDLLDQLKLDKKVAPELRAKPSLEAIKKLDTTLSGKPGSFDPRQPRFRQENGDLIAQLTESLKKMKKTYGDTKAFKNAAMIGKRYGVDVD